MLSRVDMIPSYPHGIYNLVETIDFNQIYLIYKYIVVTICQLHCFKHFININLFNTHNSLWSRYQYINLIL